VEPTALSPARRDQYLARLGWELPVAADLATLRGLHRRHLLTFPFENLDIHLGVPIELDPERILTKLLDRNRGGFCFELNGSLAGLLRTLGFTVDLLEARVYEKVGDPLPFGHLTLRIDLDGTRYLADVGFGSGFDEPILLDERGDQPDTGGTFRLVERDDELDLCLDGEPAYQIALPTRSYQDFSGGCRWHQTAPESIFAQGTVCTRRTVDGRDTLAGTTFIQTVDGERTTIELGSPAELRHALITHFDVDLSRAEVENLVSGRHREDFATNW
jgi:N-hydroxyarylamine O-acetyltransferase